MGLMAGFAACCMPYIKCFPFFPVQSQSTELPATSEGESSRGGFPQGHRTGPLAVLLFFMQFAVCGCRFKPGPLANVGG